MNQDEMMIIQAHSALNTAIPEEMSAEEKFLIERAFSFSRKAHNGQKRASGIPYILHPLGVALIVMQEMRLKDAPIIAVALLHDVIEDTPYGFAEIKDAFGDEIASMVCALTKTGNRKEDYLLLLRELMLGNVQVLYVKLADRLHNMRTLSALGSSKQNRIALETRSFFAPIAGYLGLDNLKSELEDLAFSFLNSPNCCGIWV